MPAASRPAPSRGRRTTSSPGRARARSFKRPRSSELRSWTRTPSGDCSTETADAHDAPTLRPTRRDRAAARGRRLRVAGFASDRSDRANRPERADRRLPARSKRRRTVNDAEVQFAQRLSEDLERVLGIGIAIDDIDLEADDGAAHVMATLLVGERVE